MSVQIFHTHSDEETIALGEAIAARLPQGATVLLIGNLGAGKTTLAKGIIRGLGAASPEDVSSPTFSLIHEYGEGRKVYHVDLYRLDSARDAAFLGLSEIVDGPDIVLVEWGERFPELWPPAHIEIHLNRIGDESREISVHDVGQTNPGPYENVSR